MFVVHAGISSCVDFIPLGVVLTGWCWGGFWILVLEIRGVVRDCVWGGVRGCRCRRRGQIRSSTGGRDVISLQGQDKENVSIQDKKNFSKKSIFVKRETCLKSLGKLRNSVEIEEKVRIQFKGIRESELITYRVDRPNLRGLDQLLVVHLESESDGALWCKLFAFVGRVTRDPVNSTL